MSAYLKAIAAAVVGGLVTVVEVLMAANSDGEITSDEWQLIVSTVAGAVAATVAVWAARNTPAPTEPPLPPPVP